MCMNPVFLIYLAANIRLAKRKCICLPCRQGVENEDNRFFKVRTQFSITYTLMCVKCYTAQIQSNLIWLKRINLSHRCWAIIVRMVPDLERMTMLEVRAPLP